MNHSTLKKKLATYSATACAIIIVKEADAQIVYTDIADVTISLLGDSHYALDLNNDGHVDFILRVMDKEGIHLASVSQGPNEVMAVYDAYARPLQLQYGQKINSQQDWYGLGSYNMLLAYSSYFSYAGPWNGGAVDGYMGLRFTEGGNTYYGWVRLDLNKSASKMTIMDYAYNSSPGAGIKAGNTGGNGCPDSFEPNNSVAAAKLVPFNSSVTIQLNQAGDEDWFYFVTNSFKKNIRVSLNHLPADYDLQLFDANQNLIGQSTNNGNANEQIIQDNIHGGYIRVYGKNNAFSPDHCFTLLVETRTHPFREASSTLPENSLTVFPNPATDQLTISGLSVTGEPSELFISTLNGKVLKIIPVNETVQRVDVDDLAAGMYLLHLKNSSEQRVIKFIVSR